MRILILSNTPWAMNNSFGNSFSNIFGGMQNVEIANIYCRYGKPDNNVVERYFQITEKSLIWNLINKKNPSGKEIINEESTFTLSNTDENVFNYARKKRYQIYFWLRDIIWKVGRWKSRELAEFIQDFKPDIIFQPLYYSNYLNAIALYLKTLTNVPMVCYVSDDVYTMRQFSLSPLYWLDRIIKRRIIKRVVNNSEYIYVISDIQKQEYEKIFKKKCKLLVKGENFNEKSLNSKTHLQVPLKMVFTGNVSAGRWKSLEFIVNALEKINSKEILAEIYIYTMTPLTKTMKKSLYSEGNSFLMGGVPAKDIPQIQDEADILIHIESTKLTDRLNVRHSFSTKLVDYFKAQRCIFAVGKDDVASIDYLLKEDAAIVAQSEEDVLIKLNKLINNKNLIMEYADKAWSCGERNHQIDEIQMNLYSQLSSLAKED